MRLPSYKDMIDEDTIAFFPLNGNLNNEVSGGGTLTPYSGQYPIYTNITIANKTIQCLYHTTSSNGRLSFSDTPFLDNNDFTVDFMFRIFQNNTGYICRFFEYRGYSSSVGLRIGERDDASYNYFVIANAGSSNTLFWYTPLDEKFKSTYHHMAVTKKDTDLFTFFLDGKLVLSRNITLGSNVSYLIDIRRSNPANLFYYRIRKGIKYTEDFTSPLEDPYYFLNENNNNVYGKKKE